MIDFTGQAQLRAANERIAKIDGYTLLSDTPMGGKRWSRKPKSLPYSPPDYHKDSGALLRVLRKICETSGRSVQMNIFNMTTGIEFRLGISLGIDGIAPTFEKAAFSAIIQYLDRGKACPECGNDKQYKSGIAYCPCGWNLENAGIDPFSPEGGENAS